MIPLQHNIIQVVREDMTSASTPYLCFQDVENVSHYTNFVLVTSFQTGILYDVDPIQLLSSETEAWRSIFTFP